MKKRVISSSISSSTTAAQWRGSNTFKKPPAPDPMNYWESEGVKGSSPPRRPTRTNDSRNDQLLKTKAPVQTHRVIPFQTTDRLSPQLSVSHHSSCALHWKVAKIADEHAFTETQTLCCRLPRVPTPVQAKGRGSNPYQRWKAGASRQPQSRKVSRLESNDLVFRRRNRSFSKRRSCCAFVDV